MIEMKFKAVYNGVVLTDEVRQYKYNSFDEFCELWEQMKTTHKVTREGNSLTAENREGKQYIYTILEPANNMEQLNHQIAVFVPSTFDGNKPAKRMQKKAVKHAARRFCRYFGGCTATTATGFWNSPTKGLIPEKQVIIYANCTEADKAKYTEAVTTFAKALCRWMKQEAVTVQVDNALQFVEA